MTNSLPWEIIIFKFGKPSINETFPMIMMMTTMKIGSLSTRHEAISTDAGSHPAIVETGATTRGRGTDLI